MQNALRSLGEAGLVFVDVGMCFLMRYVYLIQSVSNPDKKYVGLSYDVAQRLNEHNAGQSIYTNKYKPWALVAQLGFADEQKAFDFERYLKHGSGHAFAKRHFW